MTESEDKHWYLNLPVTSILCPPFWYLIMHIRCHRWSFRSNRFCRSL